MIPTILTSAVVVKSSGSTFDVSESVKLPSGATATTDTTWDAATLMPVHYALQQKGNRTIDLQAAITPASIDFTGSAKLSYAPIAGTKFMVVSEGLNGNQTIRGEGTTASPPPNGPAGDSAVTYALDPGQITAWYSPQTKVVDREFETPGDGHMQLIKYTPQ